MKEVLEKYLARIDELGGNTKELIFENPASELAVLSIEKELTYKLPADFRQVLLVTSAHCEFNWFLPEGFYLPNQLKQIFCGELRWGIEFIMQFNKDKDRWVREVFYNADDEYDKVWHNKFVFQEVSNGDYISLDLSVEKYGQVVYLSHDDGEGHGYVMANSFHELLKNWTQLGCVGGEDWQWLPFCQSRTSGIDAECSNAQAWYKAIGLK
jgi:cell wall assembly regulator SMI1